MLSIAAMPQEAHTSSASSSKSKLVLIVTYAAGLQGMMQQICKEAHPSTKHPDPATSILDDAFLFVSSARKQSAGYFENDKG
jgi:hypothetical protein